MFLTIKAGVKIIKQFMWYFNSAYWLYSFSNVMYNFSMKHALFNKRDMSMDDNIKDPLFLCV